MPTGTHSIEPILAQLKARTIELYQRAEGKSRTNYSDRSESTTLNWKLGLNQDASLQVWKVREWAQTQHPILQKTIEWKVQLHSSQKLPGILAAAEKVQLSVSSSAERRETKQNSELESAKRKNQTQLLRKTAHKQLPTRTNPRVQLGEQRNWPINLPSCSRIVIFLITQRQSN